MACTLDQSQATGSITGVFGLAVSIGYQGNQFIPSTTGTLCRIDCTLRLVGSPTDAVSMKVYIDNGADQTGSLVATSTNTIPYTGLTTTLTTKTFTFTSGIVNAGTKYWWVVYRTGSNDGTNYYGAGYSSSNPYASGLRGRGALGAFTSYATDDMYFAQYSEPSAGGNLKSYNTNLMANIKTINTNPIANIKTLNTNTLI